MNTSQTRPRPPSVRTLGTQYLVTLGDGSVHVVGKDKRCHVCHDRCQAVAVVRRHLQHGGQRAPDETPEPESKAIHCDPMPSSCPICGSPVARDTILDHRTRGTGWRCAQGGTAHLYQHRYAHLKAWFCGEGAKRHHMFIPTDSPIQFAQMPQTA